MLDFHITIQNHEVGEKLDRLEKKIDTIMADQTEQEIALNGALDELKTEVLAAKERDAATLVKLDAITAELEALKAKQPDLTDEITRVQGITAEARTINAPPVVEA